eukprot:gene26744-35426_t
MKLLSLSFKNSWIYNGAKIKHYTPMNAVMLKETVTQVQNIASKTLEGKLSEALQESAEYIKKRQEIDKENLRRLTEGLARSRDRLLGGISGVFNDVDASIDAKLLSLEEVLLQSDIGSTTTNTIIEDLRSYASSEGLKNDDILPVLRERLIEALTPPVKSELCVSPNNLTEPTVIFVIGANGMGKTTTIGKIAGRLHNELNQSVLLGACDTFRAAAVEQLSEWATRAQVSIEKPTDLERGGDPVPVDMKAAIKKEIPSAPHETLLVVDGSLGRNAVEQANVWMKYVGITGLVVTKMDGTARGGFVVSVVKDLGVPIKFIGVGEKIQDLRDFEPEVFVDALLGNTAEKSAELKKKARQMLKYSTTSTSLSPSLSAVSASDRLKASFSKNSVSSLPEANAIAKPKRPKRVKPAAAKKKK